MKRNLQIIVVSLLMLAGAERAGAADELTLQLQKGLLEEEEHRNYGEALKAYQAAVAVYDTNRQAAATAVFRLAETYRKLGKTNEARVQYERVVIEFADQSVLVGAANKQLQTDFGKLATPNFLANPIPENDPKQKQLRADLQLLEAQLVSWKRLDSRQLATALLQVQPDQRMETILKQQDELRVARASRLKEFSKDHPVITSLDAALEENDRILAEHVFPLRKQLEERARLMREKLDGIATATQGSNSTRVVNPVRIIPGDAASMREQVRQIVERNKEDSNGTIPTEEKAEIERLQAMLKNSPDLINAKVEGQPIPLHKAAGLGQTAVAEFLIKNGADINRKDVGIEMTPLLAAAQNGHKAIVELLLKHGAQKDETDARGITPLIFAASKGYRAVVEELIGAGADVNVQDNGGYAALHYAAGAGDLEMTMQLLKAKADTGLKTVSSTWMNRKDEKGATPLHLAAKTNNLAVVSVLLAAGADINAPDANGWTPLFIAFTQGSGTTVKKLLDAKADVRVRTLGGYTILHFIKKSTTEELVRQLLQAGAAVNVKDESRSTPLMSAVRNDNLEVAKLLLENGADPNVLPRDGLTPLLTAISAKSMEMVRLLLANKAKADKLPEASPWQHPVIVAAKSGETDILKELINHGADLSVTNDKGYTSLHYAVAAMNEPMVELLLKHKADPNAESNDGETPVTLAQGGKVRDLDFIGRPPTLPPSLGQPPRVIRSSPLASSRAITESEMKAEFEQILKLLVEHGGDEFFKRRKAIFIFRKASGMSPGTSREVLFRDRAGVNRYSLYELLASIYEKDGSGYEVAFPDFSRITIKRLVRGKIEEMILNLTPSLEGGDCKGDQWLEWGDMVEIPETDHSLSQAWNGLSETIKKTLQNCNQRKVELKVKGQTYAVKISPGFVNANSAVFVRSAIAAAPTQVFTNLYSFRLSAMVYQSNALLASSDPKRVKVIRKLPESGKTKEMLYDITTGPDNVYDLWLRDGDVIEVPEKE